MTFVTLRKFISLFINLVNNPTEGLPQSDKKGPVALLSKVHSIQSLVFISINRSRLEIVNSIMSNSLVFHYSIHYLLTTSVLIGTAIPRFGPLQNRHEYNPQYSPRKASINESIQICFEGFLVKTFIAAIVAPCGV